MHLITLRLLSPTAWHAWRSPPTHTAFPLGNLHVKSPWNPTKCAAATLSLEQFHTALTSRPSLAWVGKSIGAIATAGGRSGDVKHQQSDASGHNAVRQIVRQAILVIPKSSASRATASLWSVWNF